MINARMMYMRPGNLFKTFVIESNEQKLTDSGRPYNSFSGNSCDNTLRGCLAEADTEVKERWKRLDHIVTHTIVSPGARKSKVNDRLVLNDRIFIVKGTDDCGALGVSCLYYVEERFNE